MMCGADWAIRQLIRTGHITGEMMPEAELERIRQLSSSEGAGKAKAGGGKKRKVGAKRAAAGRRVRSAVREESDADEA
jgi:hypothetical protein